MQNQPTTATPQDVLEQSGLNRECKVCQTPYSGNFCPSCGQKYIDKRFNMRDSVAHVFGVVLNFDRGLWHTIIYLFKNPGKVIRDYLNGATTPYFHPFRFLFLLLTLQVFIMISTDMVEFIQQSFAVGYGEKPIPDELKGAMSFINSYMHVLIAMSMPVVAAGSWLFFKKAGYHYAEHLIISCFAYGQTIFISLVMMPIYFISVNAYLVASSLSLLIAMFYFTYVYLSVFKGRKWVIVIKAIGVYMVASIGVGVMTILAMIVYFARQYAKNPEFFEQFKNAGQ